MPDTLALEAKREAILREIAHLGDMRQETITEVPPMLQIDLCCSCGPAAVPKPELP